MNLAAHQEKENEKTVKRKAVEERKQPILERLRAALVRSFRVHHGEKMVYKVNTRDNWDSWEGQQPFRPNPNGVGNRATTLRRLLIGAAFPGRFLSVSSI